MQGPLHAGPMTVSRGTCSHSSGTRICSLNLAKAFADAGRRAARVGVDARAAGRAGQRDPHLRRRLRRRVGHQPGERHGRGARGALQKNPADSRSLGGRALLVHQYYPAFLESHPPDAVMPWVSLRFLHQGALEVSSSQVQRTPDCGCCKGSINWGAEGSAPAAMTLTTAGYALACLVGEAA